MVRLPRTSYRSKSARCFPQGSSTVQQVGTARACSRAALIRDVSMAFRDLGATPFSINRLRRRLESWTTAIRPSGNSTSPSCQAIPSGAASGSVIQASLGSWLTVLVHHVPSPWIPHLDVGSVRRCERLDPVCLGPWRVFRVNDPREERCARHRPRNRCRISPTNRRRVFPIRFRRPNPSSLKSSRPPIPNQMRSADATERRELAESPVSLTILRVVRVYEGFKHRRQRRPVQ